jgi:hypothetical protein
VGLLTYSIHKSDQQRGDQEFPFLPPLSRPKLMKIKCLTYALIFVQKTIPPIYRNRGSIDWECIYGIVGFILQKNSFHIFLY